MDPGVIERLICGIPRLNIFLNQTHEELLRLWRVSLERLVIEMEVTFNDITNDFKLRISWEGHFTREHDIENDTKGPNVDLRVVVLKENLWSDIVWLNKS